MWYRSPIVFSFPSSPINPFAKSELCVTVHSDWPSPWTMIFRPLFMRSTAADESPDRRPRAYGRRDRRPASDTRQVEEEKERLRKWRIIASSTAKRKEYRKGITTE